MRVCGEQVIQAAYKRSPELIEPMLPTVYAYMYRYLARLCLQGGDTRTARDLIDQAWICDKSIFCRDVRSLITLFAVCLAPVAKIAVKHSLGTVKSLRTNTIK